MHRPIPTCPRHPDVETRLRCSACDTPICPDCGREAAVGIKCPDCATHDEAVHGRDPRQRGGALGAWRTARDAPLSARGRDRGTRPGDAPVPTPVAVRAAVVGLVAAVFGGGLLGPILTGGTFLLLSSGVIGWGVARAVYWATQERSSPFVRAVALTAAGLAVVVGTAMAGADVTGSGLALLAYPAAVYGGWIVVRQR